MQSYYDKNVQTSKQLNPNANIFNPANANNNMTNPSVLPQSVRPKERTMTNSQNVDALISGTIPTCYTQLLLPRAPTPLQEETAEPVSVHVSQAPIVSKPPVVSKAPVVCDVNQNDLVKVMQKQNEITSLLVQQNLSSALPARHIPVFDGDPLQYFAFMRAFENGVEMKTDNFKTK